LASSLEKGSQERKDLLRFLKFAEDLEDQVFTNPETGNKVKFKSLPPEVQKKIREKVQGEDKGGLKGAAKEKFSSWLAKAKGLTDKAKDRVKALPADAQKFVSDPEFRKELTTNVAKDLKASPKKYAKQVMHHFEHEVHEVKGALKNASQGKLPTKSQAKAIAGLAVEVGVAALAVQTGGLAGAGFHLGKSLAKHAALSALHGRLGDAYVFGFGGSHLLEGLLHVAGGSSKKKPKSENAEDFIEDLALAIAEEMEKGFDDKTIIQVLDAEEEKEDEGAAKSASGSKVYTLTTPKGPREFTDLKELIAYQRSISGIRTTPVIRWTDANGVSHKLALGDFFRQGFRSHREGLKRLEKMIQEKELRSEVPVS
jgi:hypothetical protein